MIAGIDHWQLISKIQREKLGTLGRVPEIYTNIYHLHGLYNGCIGQYGVILGEQLPGYTPKGTQHFPLKNVTEAASNLRSLRYKINA